MKRFVVSLLFLAGGGLAGWSANAWWSHRQEIARQRVELIGSLSNDLDAMEADANTVQKGAKSLFGDYPMKGLGLRYEAAFTPAYPDGKRRAGMVVKAVLRDSPAGKAGVLPGDQLEVIGSVDLGYLESEQVSGLSEKQVAGRLKSEEGKAVAAFLATPDPVAVTLYRPSINKALTVKLKREVVGENLHSWADSRIVFEGTQLLVLPEFFDPARQEIDAIRKDLDQAEKKGNTAAVLACSERVVALAKKFANKDSPVSEFNAFLKDQFVRDPAAP